MVKNGRSLQKWDADVHNDILATFMNHFQPKSEDWRAIVSALHKQGYQFTESALQYVCASEHTLFSHLTSWFLCLRSRVTEHKSLPFPLFSLHSVLLQHQTSHRNIRTSHQHAGAYRLGSRSPPSPSSGHNPRGASFPDPVDQGPRERGKKRLRVYQWCCTVISALFFSSLGHDICPPPCPAPLSFITLPFPVSSPPPYHVFHSLLTTFTTSSHFP